jgi:glutaredoxin
MIVVYGTDKCKQCKKAKEYLNKHNIKYKYYDLSKKENRIQRKEYRNNKWVNLPVIKTDEWSLDGFNETVLENLLNV